MCHQMTMTIATDSRSTKEESDACLIASGRCPVCEKTIGAKRSRHSVTMHLNRATDIEHRIWVTSNYKKHFRHGRTKRPPPVVEKEAVLQMLARNLGEQMVMEMFNVNITL